MPAPTRLRHPHKVAKQARYYRRQAKAARAKGQHHNAAELEAHAAALEGALRRAKRCRCCGRRLDDPTSVARGIGSTCWARGHR